MIESILAIGAAVLGLVLWLIKRQAAQYDAKAPQRTQEATDADVLNPDRRWYSLRISDLHDKLQRKRQGARREP